MTRRELEITDLNEIKYILDKGKVIHLGLCMGDEPYVVPMSYGYLLREERLTIYLHGARRGYKYDVIAANPKVSFSIEADLVPFEGDVACKYGMSYKSVLGKGLAHIIDDPAEKAQALSLLMKTQTGGDFTFNDKLCSVVNVIRIDVTEYTAKARPMPKN